MLDTDTTLDLSVLEELDFPVTCSHPQHETRKSMHDEGPAEWIYVLNAPCGYRATRTVCNKFGLLAPGVPEWECLGCGGVHLGIEVDIHVEPLNVEL